MTSSEPLSRESPEAQARAGGGPWGGAQPDGRPSAQSLLCLPSQPGLLLLPPCGAVLQHSCPELEPSSWFRCPSLGAALPGHPTACPQAGLEAVRLWFVRLALGWQEPPQCVLWARWQEPGAPAGPARSPPPPCSFQPVPCLQEGGGTSLDPWRPAQGGGAAAVMGVGPWGSCLGSLRVRALLPPGLLCPLGGEGGAE